MIAPRPPVCQSDTAKWHEIACIGVQNLVCLAFRSELPRHQTVNCGYIAKTR